MLTLNTLRNSASNLLRGLKILGVTLLLRPAYALKALTPTLQKLILALLDARFRDAFKALLHLLIKLAQQGFYIGFELSCIVLNTLVTVFDSLLGNLHSRTLTPEEIDYLFPVFGNSLRYTPILIQTGGLKAKAQMRSHVVGDNVYLSALYGHNTPTFNCDGCLTSAGLYLLGHEITHVWQYQNQSTQYISESIRWQLLHGVKATYDWRSDVLKNTPFTIMNVEKQAQIAELMCKTIALKRLRCTTSGWHFHREDFNQLLNATRQRGLTEEQYQPIEEAHRYFLTGYQQR